MNNDDDAYVKIKVCKSKCVRFGCINIKRNTSSRKT